MPDASEYVTGTPHPNQRETARFETKAGTGTGAGYERWRSKEHRPHTPGTASEDVYVAHHRLLAVVACYPADMAVADILAHMADKDVHHDAPEVDPDAGVKWDNRPEAIRVVEHGRHAEITQAQMRAWARDAKRSTRGPQVTADPDGVCAACGAAEDTLATTASLEGSFCIDCVTDRARGETIEVL